MIIPCQNIIKIADSERLQTFTGPKYIFFLPCTYCVISDIF